MTGSTALDEIDIRGFWGPRPEGVDGCADRLHGFLSRAGQRDGALAHWFRTGETRTEALRQPVSVDPTWLRDWLRDEGPAYDDDGNVMEDLGYGVGSWNGNGTAELHLSCGGWSRNVDNRCVLGAQESVANRLWQPETAEALITDLAECWQPDIATVSCFDQYGELPRALRWYAPGWLTYLGPAFSARLSGVPDTTTATPLGDGLLLQLNKDPDETTTEDLLDLRDAIGPAIEQPQQTWRHRMRNTTEAVTRLAGDGDIGRDLVLDRLNEILDLARSAHDPQTAELVETVKAIEESSSTDEVNNHLVQLRGLLAEENDPYHRV